MVVKMKKFIKKLFYKRKGNTKKYKLFGLTLVTTTKKAKQDGKLVKKMSLMSMPVYKEVVNIRKKKCYFLGIQLISCLNKKSPIPSQSEIRENLSTFLYRNDFFNGKFVLWIDHSLGGGTEVYSYNQFKTTYKNYVILRLQYFPAYKQYVFSVPQYKDVAIYAVRELSDVREFLCRMKFQEIVVNNLVGYESTISILKMVSSLRSKSEKISFRGHDFQSICPSFNLLDCDDKFCDLSYKTGCEDCFRKKKLGNSNMENVILRSGCESIAVWRKEWGNFFRNTVDEMIVFSKVISNIFCKIYPQLENKIKIIPHEVRNFDKVIIPEHKGINIAMLGNISLKQKGADIIRGMSTQISNYKNVQLIVIGSLHNPPHNIKVTGKYQHSDLPRIVMKEKIDLVFIPSICPETFSYTTSEAISMGLPVACYNIGAPAERVKKYEKGVVLNNMNVAANLYELVNFVKKIRKV